MPKQQPIAVQVEAINKTAANSLARGLLKLAEKMSKSPDFMAEFEAWQIKRQQEAAPNGAS